ncbi:MAG: NAD(P)(+) transhydrogenase (Re/Si-specific) subunit beta [Clostridia bacterium]|nr:NAD(P)(+) transhydrogenase (Re/Si-specific) subunit beta [Clostridia bacterium]
MDEAVFIVAAALLLAGIVLYQAERKRRASEDSISTEDVKDLAGALKKVFMDVQEPKKEPDASHPASALLSAERVLIVPGEGMVASQAQLQAKQLAFLLEKRGAYVRFLLHPEAGRAPGEVRSLLDEAELPSTRIDAPSPDVRASSYDVCVVIGACDIVNRALRSIDPVDIADVRHVIICNYNTRPGMSGLPNTLYGRTDGVTFLLGDAKDSLQLLLDGLEV